MIIGIGTDIIEIARVEKAIEKTESFLRKVYTEKEQAAYLKNNKKVETLAGLFSAKEAVSKALGTGFRGFSFLDIEILSNDLGKPEVTLYGVAKKLSETLGITRVHVSISHSKSHATSFAIAEGGNASEIINTNSNECS